MRLSETYHSSPTIGADGTIYLGQASVNPTLIAVTDDGTSATQKWAYYGNGVNYSSAAIGADGTIYFLDNAGYLNALGPMVPSPVPDQPAATTSYDSTATADVTLNFPPGVAADDICVAEFSDARRPLRSKRFPMDGPRSAAITAASPARAEYLYWYKSLGGGSDPEDFTWTLNSSTNTIYAGWIQCFSGVNPDAPIDPNNPTGVGITSTSATSLSVPALSNLAQSNEALILNCVARRGTGANPWSGPVSPYSQIVGSGASGLVSASSVNLIAYSGTAASNEAPPVQTCTQNKCGLRDGRQPNRAATGPAHSDRDAEPGHSDRDFNLFLRAHAHRDGNADRNRHADRNGHCDGHRDCHGDCNFDLNATAYRDADRDADYLDDRDGIACLRQRYRRATLHEESDDTRHRQDQSAGHLKCDPVRLRVCPQRHRNLRFASHHGRAQVVVHARSLIHADAPALIPQP